MGRMHVLGNGPPVLGILVMGQMSEFCYLRLCHIRDYVVRDYVAFVEPYYHNS